MAKEVIGEVLLRDVRLSFENIFEPQENENEDGTTRKTYKANFLIPKSGDKHDNVKRIKAAAEEAKAKKWGKDKSDHPKLKPEKICLRDGDLEDWDGYAGHFYMSTTAQLNSKPQVITNRKSADGKWIEAEPGEKRAPYSGCYVNALVRVWAQDNKHGKRLNASLEIVQFLRDGDAFGASRADANEKFSEDMVSDEGDLADDDDPMPEVEDDDSGLL